jgi:hypothetical protein
MIFFVNFPNVSRILAEGVPHPPGFHVLLLPDLHRDQESRDTAGHSGREGQRTLIVSVSRENRKFLFSRPSECDSLCFMSIS